MRRYVAEVSAAGGQYRVTDAPLEKMAMIDRAHVFIADLAHGRDSTAGAWHIRDYATIGYLARLFELEWMRSTPWEASPPPSEATAEPRRTETITSPRQRFILRGICSGMSYERIGRQLSIKVRTVGNVRDLARPGLHRLTGQTMPETTSAPADVPERTSDRGRCAPNLPYYPTNPAAPRLYPSTGSTDARRCSRCHPPYMKPTT
ncbi:hypothetical protein AB0J01_37760 [Streptomyces sp. NPDC050204]|uniref:helix-turn-helix transcriptional regulator n=1 Tax=Streptomyces sp. NPDC050204 TaxID=3155514 RepID=UPI003422B482